MSETPILDLQQDPPKRKISKLGLAIGVLVGAILGFAMVEVTDPARSSPLAMVWWIPGFYVAIAIHELGHFVAARLAGMQAGGMAIGGFCLMKSGDNWTFRFDRRFVIGGFFKPLPPVGELRRARFAWMVAGGPLGSIAWTAAFWLLSLKFSSGAGMAGTRMQTS
jgi:Peptidase family M50